MGNGGGSLTAHVAPPVLGDQLAVLDGPPVPVRFLHVGHHGILRLVRRHKDNLDAVNLLVEILEDGGEASARRAPVSGEVDEDDVLVGQGLRGGLLGAIGLDEAQRLEDVHVGFCNICSLYISEFFGSGLGRNEPRGT